MSEVPILQSIVIIVLFGMLFQGIFKKLKLPGLIGLLLLGLLTGPFILNIIDSKTLEISDIIRKIALIIILIRAGLGIKKSDILKVGTPAIKLSFIPILLEASAIILSSMWLFSFDFLTSALLGCIISAVSPAIIVPSMLELTDKKIGEKKKIPTMILASSSIDDVVAITLFTIFLGFSINGGITTSSIIEIPTGIFLGIILGILFGITAVFLFRIFKLASLYKALIIFGFSTLLVVLETLVDEINYISIISLLSVIILSFIILEKDEKSANDVSPIFKSIWIFASLFLFVLVGAKVDPNVAIEAGLKGLIIISIGLIFRSLGVYISLLGTNLTLKEKLFCIYSFFPKATVQAAIGAIPLSLGIEGGEIILAVSILSIITTAPLGAFLISKYSYLIEDESENKSINNLTTY